MTVAAFSHLVKAKLKKSQLLTEYIPKLNVESIENNLKRTSCVCVHKDSTRSFYTLLQKSSNLGSNRGPFEWKTDAMTTLPPKLFKSRYNRTIW